MKKLFAIASIATLLLTAEAQADIVNFTGTNKNMGTVQSGQTGTLFNNYTLITIPFTGGLKAAASRAFGVLPSASKITFTYSLASLTNVTYLRDSANYSYIQGGDLFAGNAADSTATPATATGTINAGASAPLVFATANIAGNVGTTTISNYSGGFANFSTLFAGFLRGNPTLTYAVSSVPLPAALPMFSALFAGMFAFARKRRNAAALAA